MASEALRSMQGLRRLSSVPFPEFRTEGNEVNKEPEASSDGRLLECQYPPVTDAFCVTEGITDCGRAAGMLSISPPLKGKGGPAKGRS
jgi:hypothetical protein